MISRKQVTQVYCTLSCIPMHDHNESYNQGRQRRPCNCTADPAPGVPAGAPHTSEAAFYKDVAGWNVLPWFCAGLPS